MAIRVRPAQAIDPAQVTAVLSFKDDDGRLRLAFPVVMPFTTAMAEPAAVEADEVPTYDSWKTTIELLGGTLERVVIADVRDGTFHANLELLRDGERAVVDCRPCDAVTLARLTGCPVFVEESVLEAVADDERLAAYTRRCEEIIAAFDAAIDETGA